MVLHGIFLTNGGTATKVSGGNTVDLINGDNIEITQDGI